MWYGLSCHIKYPLALCHQSDTTHQSPLVTDMTESGQVSPLALGILSKKVNIIHLTLKGSKRLWVSLSLSPVSRQDRQLLRLLILVAW